MFRNVLSSLAALALVFAFVANTNAQDLCDYDCEGSTLCEVEIDGVTVIMGGVNFMDGSDPEDVADNEKEVKIQCKELNLRDRDKQNKGTATNNADKESTITITSDQDSGSPFYPATAVVTSYVNLKLNDREYTSEDPLVLKSTDKIEGWPSERAVSYELVKDVTFVSEGGQSKITFYAGSTASMKGVQ